MMGLIMVLMVSLVRSQPFNFMQPLPNLGSTLNALFNRSEPLSINQPFYRYLAHSNLSMGGIVSQESRYVNFFPSLGLSNLANIGYTGWVENYTAPNGSTILGYPYNTNVKPIFALVCNRQTGSIVSLSIPGNLGSEWIDFIVDVSRQFSPNLTQASQFNITNQIINQSNILKVINSATNLLNTVLTSTANVSTIFANQSLNIINKNYVSTFNKIYYDQFQNTTQINLAGNQNLNYPTNYAHQINQNLLLDSQIVPDLFFINTLTIDINVALALNPFVLNSSAIQKYVGNSNIDLKQYYSLNNFGGLKLIYMSSHRLLALNRNLQTSTRYLVYSNSYQLFQDSLFSDSFSSNFSESCYLISYSDPTSLSNVITCTGNLTIQLSNVTNTTNVFTISANVINFTAISRFSSNYTFTVQKPTPQMFSMVLKWVNYQLLINFNFSMNGTRSNNQFQLNTQIASQIEVIGTQTTQFRDLSLSINQIRFRAITINPTLLLNLTQSSITGSYNSNIALNQYLIQDYVGITLLNIASQNVPVACLAFSMLLNIPK